MKPFIIFILALTVVYAAEEVKKRGLAGVSLGYNSYNFGGPYELSNGVKDYSLPLSLGSNYYLNNYKTAGIADFSKSLKLEATIPAPQQYNHGIVNSKTDSSSFQGYHYDAPKSVDFNPALSGNKYDFSSLTGASSPVKLDATKYDESLFQGKLDASALQGFDTKAPALSGKIDLAAFQKASQASGASFPSLGGHKTMLDSTQSFGSYKTVSNVPVQQSSSFEGYKVRESPSKDIEPLGNSFDTSALKGYNFGGKLSSTSLLGDYKLGSYSAPQTSIPSFGGKFDLSSVKYTSTPSLGHSTGFKSNSVQHIDAKELGFSDHASAVQGHQSYQGPSSHSQEPIYQSPSYEASNAPIYGKPKTPSYEVPNPPSYEAPAAHDYQGAGMDSYQQAAIESYQGHSTPVQSSPVVNQYDTSSFGKYDFSGVGGKVDASQIQTTEFETVSQPGGDFKYDGGLSQSPHFDFSSVQSDGIKQINSPDLSQSQKQFELPSTETTYPTQQMDKTAAASQQALALGSGSLGVTRLANGKFALGSGSLGYAASSPAFFKALPAQPQQQSFTYDSAYLKGI